MPASATRISRVKLVRCLGLGGSWAEKALEIVQGNRRETLCVFCVA